MTALMKNVTNEDIINFTDFAAKVKVKINLEGVAKIHPTGFEPVQLTLFELESNPLDHSGIDAPRFDLRNR